MALIRWDSFSKIQQRLARWRVTLRLIGKAIRPRRKRRPRSEMARYLEAREKNRDQFADAYPSVHQAFEISLRAFGLLADQLREGRDKNGKTHVSLAPFFFIMQRQVMAAFDALSARQAYLAWVTVRPGVECALIMGKWVDDKTNADVWSNRFNNRAAYRKAYEGRALESRALPRAAAIRKALSEINDLFVHPNPMYYYRHLKLDDLEDGAVEMKIDFFDEEEDFHTGILGILHLVVSIQDSLAEMFNGLFTNASPVDVGLRSLETNAEAWAAKLMAQSPKSHHILIEAGLWPKTAV